MLQSFCQLLTLNHYSSFISPLTWTLQLNCNYSLHKNWRWGEEAGRNCIQTRLGLDY